ncbi:MAG: riboflavin synthase [Calditrichaeota bacterium]|nr:MAG: riboflavin synthase [Calditrichota bacterium]MBL1206410.1 riboflavin synthase [Calditrichota bacterium]NOG46236.1 riboflavin synthase [Calditrichota bacterium]
MFTGLIEELGNIKKINPIKGGLNLLIGAKDILDDLSVDDSVAVNGVCLTATKITDSGFWVDAVGETLQKTTIGKFKTNQKVNLERAVSLNTRLGGHMVQGHVNGKAVISRITKLGKNYALDVIIDKQLERYTILEGSISLDGISLTIARLSGTSIGINIIPHTWANTNLAQLKVGDHMNVEVDVIAKYVERLLSFSGRVSEKELTIQKIKDLGF